MDLHLSDEIGLDFGSGVIYSCFVLRIWDFVCFFFLIGFVGWVHSDCLSHSFSPDEIVLKKLFPCRLLLHAGIGYFGAKSRFLK